MKSEENVSTARRDLLWGLLFCLSGEAAERDRSVLTLLDDTFCTAHEHGVLRVCARVGQSSVRNRVDPRSRLANRVGPRSQTGLALGHACETGLALGRQTDTSEGWHSGGTPTPGGKMRTAKAPTHQRTNAPKHQTTNAPKHHPPYALLPKSQALRPEPEERALAGDELMVSVPSGSTLARAARVRTPVPSWFTINDSGMLRKSILAPPRPPALAPSAPYLSQPL